jgi:hypothetical protein
MRCPLLTRSGHAASRCGSSSSHDSSLRLPREPAAKPGMKEFIRALTEHQLAHAEEMKGMSRENALVEFVKYQLRPLAARD